VGEERVAGAGNGGRLGPTERFANGRKVASYLGLIPSERSSGGHDYEEFVRRGAHAGMPGDVALVQR
jgi:transposase